MNWNCLVVLAALHYMTSADIEVVDGEEFYSYPNDDLSLNYALNVLDAYQRSNG